MKNVRVVYKKKSLLKFISHLDTNRFMIRALRRTDIPFWYTEGFNRHLYINFALPLSLGFESDYEIMELKLSDDDYPLEAVKKRIEEVMPEQIEIISVENPVMKNSEIAFAEFNIVFDGDVLSQINEFISREEILIGKKNKKGVIKTVNLADKIKSWNTKYENGATVLNIVLPAGSSENINPTLFLDALKEEWQIPFYEITRHSILNSNLEKFI